MSNVKQYRKKPVVIEAVLWDGESRTVNTVLVNFMGHNFTYYPQESTIKIPTLEGEMLANKADYIIKGVQGEFYPCKPDIFEATYEAVES